MEQNNLSKLDAGILILLLSAVSYGIAYVFEFSFQEYYHLPVMFIDITINSMIRPILLTVALLGVIFYLSITFAGIIMKTNSSIGPMPIWVAIFFIVLMFLGSYVLGKNNASEREEYLILKEKEETFVGITTYKDLLVLAPVDLERKIITPKFHLIEMKSIKTSEVIRIYDGLKVKELKTADSYD